MSTPKLTPRFPPSVEPVRVGVYPVEIRFSPGVLTLYSLWDGEWKAVRATPEEAAKQTLTSDRCYSVSMRGWRGLAKPPKGA